MSNFAEVLRRLRQEAGFHTAYAFYHKNGGKRTFPFTYAYYAKLERGEGLPRGKWLDLLLSMLRIRPTQAAKREFILAFLSDLVGDNDAFNSLVSPLLKPSPDQPSEKKVIKRLLSGQAYHLSPKQLSATLSTSPAYWVFNCVINNARAMTEEELTAVTGFSKIEIKNAVAKLSKEKLLKKGRGGRHSSPLACRYIVYPRGYKGYESDLRKLEHHLESMGKSKGEEILKMGTLIRTRRDSVAETSRTIVDALEAVSADSVYEAEAGTGLFSVETRIRKLLSF
jgi:hypothetical protein